MTNEEYLRVCGWLHCDGSAHAVSGPKPPWHHPLRLGMYTEEQAVEVQLTEDRERYNFMRERSDMHGGMLTPVEPVAPPAPSPIPLFAPDRLGQNVAAQRSGTITLCADDGLEYTFPVVPGDTAKVIAEMVEMALMATPEVPR